ncbi:MAG: hypothetical protein M1814_006639 [Vezdaea aestivalis]|nr:MAG: hypothetical protein M1814_006639 [Vezdaea aestivalis]
MSLSPSATGEEPFSPSDINHKQAATISVQEYPTSGSSASAHIDPSPPTTRHDQTDYKVYKRRWFGLAQLVLLNAVVSWDWLSFAAVSAASAAFFGVTESATTWLSTLFMFAFLLSSPCAVYLLNRGGPKSSIVAASCLLLVGNWIRYGSVTGGANRFGGVIVGQILTGFAQPFVLAAPTRYSDLWFTADGRIPATAVASLANPFGGALGQLINPFWVSKPSEIPNMVLYVSIISSVASIPSFFIPRSPPTPPCPSAAEPKIPLRLTLRRLSTSLEFYLVFIPFIVYVGLFNAFSSLIAQILSPYGFSAMDAGLVGALLIAVGLLFSAITSPLVARKPRLVVPTIKTLVPVIALSYILFIIAPPTRSVGAPYAIAALMGSASFALVPIALEFLVDLAHPASPEVTSTAAWAGGQLLGGVFLVIMTALKADGKDDPPYHMKKALIFQAVMASAVVPLPLILGLGGRSDKVKGKRVEIDKAAEEARSDGAGS